MDGDRRTAHPALRVCVHCSRFAVCILTLRLFQDDSTALSHVHFAMRRIATAQITGTATTKKQDANTEIRARARTSNGKDNAFMSRTHGHKRL
jgi:hypothetical protein